METNGQGILIYIAIAFVAAGVTVIQKPVSKAAHGVVHAGKKTALVISQPARHPLKDLKAIGYFFKTGK